MSIKVTILIPTYNRADYLRDAIGSALAQTWADIEVIVLDDASPDETPTVMQEFRGDSRLRYIRHPQNLGIANNWKAGIELAQGDFFCLLHDDDTFEPELVETLLAPLVADKNLILSFCDQWLMDDWGRRLSEASDEVSRNWKRHLLAEGDLADFASSALVDHSIPVGAALFRTASVRPEFIRPEAQGAIDMWLLYQCVRTGQSAYYVPRRLMNYREHATGMSGSRPLYMLEGQIFRSRAILADPAMTGIHPAVRDALGDYLAGYGIDLLSAGRASEARSALGEALKIRATPRALCAYALAHGGGPGAKAHAALRGTQRSRQREVAAS